MPLVNDKTPLGRDNSLDYRYNSDPICPLCDHEIVISEHELWELFKEEIHEIDCPSCNKEIKVSSHAHWTFNTDEQEE